jgi:sugar/nucleoside kinase (ribokinase family)
VVDVVAPLDVGGMTELKDLLPWIDVFLPNEDEARALTELTAPSDQLRVLAGAGVGTVIITQGGRGCVAQQGGTTYRCGAYQMDVVDPSGSGDAFTAGIISSLLRGRDLPDALRYASAIGASATRAAGTTDAVFSDREAEAFLAEHPLSVIEGP